MGMGGQILGEAWVKINLDDLKKLDLKVDDSGRRFTSQFGKMETQTQKLSKAFGALGGVIATIGIVKVGNEIFQASLKMENLNKMLLANEGSQKKANDAMAKYLLMAKSPGLNLSQITQGMTQLKSLGVSARQAEKTIMALGNQMVLSGRGAEEFGRVMVQIQQSIGKGRLMAEDLRVVAESMPMIRKLMTDAFGTADTDKLAKMGITAIDFWTKLTLEMEKSPKAIGGTQNSIDNFKDSLLQFEAALGKVVMPSVGRFLDSLTKLMDKFNAMPESTKNVIGTAVVGGLGILGIGAALSSVLIIAGQVKSALVGLGAINIASAGANIASAVAPLAASGLVNQYGRPISSAVAGVAGGAVGAGASLLSKIATKAGALAVYVVGGAGGWAGGKAAGRAIFGDERYGIYDAKGNFIPHKDVKPLTTEENEKWATMTGQFQTSYFGKPTPGIPTSMKPIAASESIMAKFTEAQLEELHKEMPGLPYMSKEELKEKAKKDSETYWQNWFDHAEAIAKQEYQIKESMPYMKFPDFIPTGAQKAKYRDQPISPSMRGGAPTFGLSDSRLGLTSGLGLGTEVSKASQDRMASIEKSYDIEKKIKDDFFSDWQKDFNDTAKEMEKYDNQWQDFLDDMGYGIEEVGREWDKTIQGTLDKLSAVYGLTTPILKELGMKGRTGERIGDVLGGAAQGAATGAVIGSAIPVIGTAIGAGIGAGIGAISGYLKGKQEDEARGYASGGWAMYPQLAMVGEREPELIIPKSKMGSDGFGGVSFGDLNVYVTSPTANVSEVKRNVLVAIKEMVAEGSLNRAVIQ